MVQNGYAPPQGGQADPWDSYEREGFQKLENFRGRVTRAWWSPPSNADFGIQLILDVVVDYVQAPVESADVKSTRLFYSLGKKNDFEIMDAVYNPENGEYLGGTTLFSPAAQQSGQQPGFVKTSKFWMLSRRAIDIKAGISQRGMPTDARVWEGLHADWVLEPVAYNSRTIEDSDITLPVALASQVAGAPVQMQPPPPAPMQAMPAPTQYVAPPQPMQAPVASPPVPTGGWGDLTVSAPAAPAPTPMAAAPIAAPAAPPPASAPELVINMDALEAANWPAYIVSIIKDQPMAVAITIINRDQATSGNSDVMNAVVHGDMLGKMVERQWLAVQGTNYVKGARG